MLIDGLGAGSARAKLLVKVGNWLCSRRGRVVMVCLWLRCGTGGHSVKWMAQMLKVDDRSRSQVLEHGDVDIDADHANYRVYHTTIRSIRDEVRSRRISGMRQGARRNVNKERAFAKGHDDNKTG